MFAYKIHLSSKQTATQPPKMTFYPLKNLLIRRTARMRPAFLVLSRVIGAVFGGYVLCAAVLALVALLLGYLGLQRSESVVASSTVGFVLYLLVLLWAFSVRGLYKLWAVLVAGTGGSLAAAWLLTTAMSSS